MFALTTTNGFLKTNMYNVILCSDINHYDNYYGRPAAIYRLASHLRAHGFAVKTINFFSRITNAEFQQLVDRYISKDTVLFGISATVLRKTETNQFFGISDTDLQFRLNYIKQQNPNIKFVLGGGQVNNVSKEKLKDFAMFDYAITGQGETALLTLVQHLSSNTKLVTSTVQRPRLITDVTYPFTEFNQTKVTLTSDDTVMPGEALPIELARGCVFKCKFCSYDLTNKNFFEFTKNKELLREELVYNYENFGTQYYSVVDDLINDSEEKVDMLLEVVESLPFPIYISGYIRLDLIWRFPSMAEKLRKIGLIACFMGIETINDASGRAVGKGLGRKRIEEALEYCRVAWGNTVLMHASMILGLPKDTRKTAEELVQWGEQMLESGALQTIGVSAMSINPWLGKAEIDKDPAAFGYTIHDADLTDERTRFVGQEANWSTTNYNFEQAKQDSEWCNQAFSKYKKFDGIDTFNISVILGLFTPALRQTTLNMLVQPLDPKKRSSIRHFIDASVKKYQRTYIEKLLEP
jgi:hypothetical protein